MVEITASYTPASTSPLRAPTPTDEPDGQPCWPTPSSDRLLTRQSSRILARLHTEHGEPTEPLGDSPKAPVADTTTPALASTPSTSAKSPAKAKNKAPQSATDAGPASPLKPKESASYRRLDANFKDLAAAVESNRQDARKESSTLSIRISDLAGDVKSYGKLLASINDTIIPDLASSNQDNEVLILQRHEDQQALSARLDSMEGTLLEIQSTIQRLAGPEHEEDLEILSLLRYQIRTARPKRLLGQLVLVT